MLTLRLLLIVDALALVGASTISDPIVGDIAVAPTLLVGVLLALACLSSDLVPPRRRIAVVCSALTIVAPFPFLFLSGSLGQRAAALAVITLQVVPLLVVGRRRGHDEAVPTSLRRILAVLVLTTSVLLLIVVALAWYGSAYLVRPPATTFVRGPYLTRVTETEAELAWQLKGSHHRTVRISALAPDGTTTTGTGGHLAGLHPGTRYVWTAEVGGRSAESGAFSTAPRSTATPITLVSFGDYGSGSAHEYAVGRLAAALDPALFLSSGDNAYLLAAPPLLDRAIFAPLRDLLGEAPTVAALGEHDLAWNDGAAVISALHLPGHHYAVQYGPVQIVVIGLQADASALAYSQAVLGNCRTPCPVRLVLTHRPIAADNPILPLLRHRHVAAVLAGHLHRYERLRRGGIFAFTVGTGGEGAGSAAYTPASRDAKTSLIAYGLLRIDIRGNRITYQFLDERGRVRDRFREAIAR